MMNTKRGTKMRGFMCHSPAATAVCMAGDPRSVIVPRRPDHRLVGDHVPFMNAAKYTRLVESHSRRLGSKNQIERSTAALPAGSRPDLKALQKPRPPPGTSSDQVFQVVVMKVSLHCQGCAGKVKKHLSKMEGVTSFSIDLETKRVTVMGHVSPVEVLESLSKVKRAELWPC
ncbi:hypothetical protein NMG60_11032647 [Bertholletia excelsa]